jgi:hypothetical protein
MPTVLTDRDGYQFIVRALDGRELEYDLPRILDRLHTLSGGWDFNTIPDNVFWAVVAAFPFVPPMQTTSDIHWDEIHSTSRTDVGWDSHEKFVTYAPTNTTGSTP